MGSVTRFGFLTFITANNSLRRRRSVSIPSTYFTAVLRLRDLARLCVPNARIEEPGKCHGFQHLNVCQNLERPEDTDNRSSATITLSVLPLDMREEDQNKQ